MATPQLSTSSVPSNPTSHNVAVLLPKLQDTDPDIRFMTLTDLNTLLNRGSLTFLTGEYTTCCKIVEGLLHTLADSHGDVQNAAIKCLGPFVNKAPETILCPTIEKISNICTEGSLDTSMPALAVREIVTALPRPSPGMPRTKKTLDSYNAVSRALIPRLIGRVVIPIREGRSLPPPPCGMLQQDLETGTDSSSLEVLTEVAKCFGPMLQDAELQALEEITTKVIDSDRCGTVMKKKAVGALSALAPYFGDTLLAHHAMTTIEKLRSTQLSSQQRKLYITVYASLARSIPQKFGPYLKTVAPFVLAPLSAEELDQQQCAEAESEGERDVVMEEVREAALIAIETFLQKCPLDMKAYAKEVLQCTARFLKYEPNVSDDEDMDMDEQEEDDTFDVDEDFEEETGFEDEDDVSWKVRRCSAKTLHALIETLDPNDQAMYSTIAPALIARFKEREETVRIEVITTLCFLVVKTGSTLHNDHTHGGREFIPQSRKRRRGLSDSLESDLRTQRVVMNGYASPTTPPPLDTAAKSLAQISPEIVRGAAKLLQTSTVPTKHVTLSLLKDLIAAQQGGLSTRGELVIDAVVDALSPQSGGFNNLAGNNLRTEALALLKVIAETHSGRVLQPRLAKIVPVLVIAAQDRFAKVAVQAMATIESFVKALTPPRSAASNTQNAEHLASLFEAIVERFSASDTDTDVRQKAVHVLGLVIGRTSGPTGQKLLSQQQRFAGQQLIAERLHNELTRLSCVRAVDTIAVLAQSKSDFRPDFVSDVALELGAQLRKSSRTLRGASLSALRTLAANGASRGCVDRKVIGQLVELLIPLLSTDDLHMMTPALIILAALAKEEPKLVAIPVAVDAICDIVATNISGAALDALITCVESIGHAGVGAALMTALLEVGVKGDVDVTGQVIGTLLVTSHHGAGVDLNSFIVELQTQTDDMKRCLALSVLGETALRTRSGPPLTPDTFMASFGDDSEKIRLAAAVALGRAAAGNVDSYLPKMLSALTKGRQYLLLHSVKELLQHGGAEDEIKPYTAQLWQSIISFGQEEDNKVVSAECIGRLAVIDPAAYLPQLQAFLNDSSPAIRGMVISALRHVLSDTSPTYNTHLRPCIQAMLETMLGDKDLDNQRLSLSTFNSAIHNKPELVLPQLPSLLPYAMRATVPRGELIREVTMGPFKHKVDDGLEIRKSAYETLYALLESSASRQRLDLPAFYDRIVAGLKDEHEIKILCCLVLSKLSVLASDETARRTDSLASSFRSVLSFKPKENAVKQELEKLNEVNKAIVKASVVIHKAFGDVDSDSRVWREYFEWIKKDLAQLVRAADEEMRESGTTARSLV